MTTSNRKWITATEVATFAYCPEAWRLEHGVKRPPANQAVREAGRTQHREWQQTERRSRSFVRTAIFVFAAAVAVWLLAQLLR